MNATTEVCKSADPYAGECPLDWTQDIAVLPGERPGTAVRLRRDPAGQVVHIEQMAYTASLGWYVQKSFTVPRPLLQPLAQSMKVADCLLASQR